MADFFTLINILYLKQSQEQPRVAPQNYLRGRVQLLQQTNLFESPAGKLFNPSEPNRVNLSVVFWTVVCIWRRSFHGIGAMFGITQPGW